MGVKKYVIVTYTAFSKTPISVPCEVTQPELLTVSRRPGARVTVEVNVNGELMNVDARDIFMDAHNYENCSRPGCVSPAIRCNCL